MKKEIKKQILELAQSIFDDNQYSKILNYLNQNRINDLRLFISDQMDFHETVFILNREDDNLRSQIELLNELENVILEEYLEIAE